MKNSFIETKLNLKKQYPLNITANITFFGLKLGIGLWLIPYMIKHLGVASYGLIPLAISITAYIVLKEFNM